MPPLDYYVVLRRRKDAGAWQRFWIEGQPTSDLTYDDAMNLLFKLNLDSARYGYIFQFLVVPDLVADDIIKKGLG